MSSILPSLLPNHWAECQLSRIAALAPVQLLRWRLLNEAGIEIAIKREDQLDHQLSGNKFYKLFGHLKMFARTNADILASLGGAYSNHIYALAAAGQRLDIPTVGIIRGAKPKTLSPTLVDASAMGMKLIFVSRSEYQNKTDSDWLLSMERLIGGTVYWVPEGGGDVIGAHGCMQWAAESICRAPWEPTHLCVAAGTGATAAGLLAASENSSVHAFVALKGKPTELEAFEHNVITLAKDVRETIGQNVRPLPLFLLESAYHCGGYARFPQTLCDFMLALEDELQLPLEPVYTAKLFLGIAQKAKRGEWPKGSRLLVFHTGGLQGRRGFAGVVRKRG